MARLSDYTGSRDNNFQLLRFLAAYGVLFAHSYDLHAVEGRLDPLERLTGMYISIGVFSVYVFFVISGYLVTGSLLKGKSLSEYTRARALRVFPALIVCILLTVFVLAPAVTTIPVSEYFAAPQTWLYLLRNSILVTGTTYDLPGVFPDMPVLTAVNGSLWTLPYELGMYALLPLLWWKCRKSIVRMTRVVVALALLGMVVMTIGTQVPQLKDEFGRLLFMFCSGSAFYLLRERIPVSGRLTLLAAAGLAATAVAGKPWFGLGCYFLLPYLVLSLAHAPAGKIRSFNHLGDYSYGIFLYAFPIQQALVWLSPGISVSTLWWQSTLATLPLAVLSWHLVEKPALACKERFRLRKQRPASIG